MDWRNLLMNQVLLNWVYMRILFHQLNVSGRRICCIRWWSSSVWRSYWTLLWNGVLPWSSSQSFVSGSAFTYAHRLRRSSCTYVRICAGFMIQWYLCCMVQHFEGLFLLDLVRKATLFLGSANSHNVITSTRVVWLRSVTLFTPNWSAGWGSQHDIWLNRRVTPLAATEPPLPCASQSLQCSKCLKPCYTWNPVNRICPWDEGLVSNIRSISAPTQ